MPSASSTPARPQIDIADGRVVANLVHAALRQDGAPVEDGDGRREPQVFGHGEPVVDARHLELDPDPGPRDLVGLEPREVEALEPDRARGGPEDPRQKLEEGALAGAVGADQTAELPAPERQVHAGDRAETPELLHDPARFQDALPHGGTSSARPGRGARRESSRPSAGTRPPGRISTITTRARPRSTVV